MPLHSSTFALYCTLSHAFVGIHCTYFTYYLLSGSFFVVTTNISKDLTAAKIINEWNLKRRVCHWTTTIADPRLVLNEVTSVVFSRPAYLRKWAWNKDQSCFIPGLLDGWAVKEWSHATVGSLILAADLSCMPSSSFTPESVSHIKWTPDLIWTFSGGAGCEINSWHQLNLTSNKFYSSVSQLQSL